LARNPVEQLKAGEMNSRLVVLAKEGNLPRKGRSKSNAAGYRLNRSQPDIVKQPGETVEARQAAYGGKKKKRCLCLIELPGS